MGQYFEADCYARLRFYFGHNVIQSAAVVLACEIVFPISSIMLRQQIEPAERYGVLRVLIAVHKTTASGGGPG